MADGQRILNVRRYYLLKRLLVRGGMSNVWRAKQEAVAGASLPDGFPSRAALVDAGYTTKEDLEGAPADELIEFAGLSSREADAVVAAWAAL